MTVFDMQFNCIFYSEMIENISMLPIQEIWANRKKENSIFICTMKPYNINVDMFKLKTHDDDIIILPQLILMLNKQHKSAVVFIQSVADINRELVLLIPFLAKQFYNKNMFVFHSACVGNSDKNRCALFIGDSGSGKTTLSNSAAKNKLAVISDELTYVLLVDNGAVLACTTNVFSENAMFQCEQRSLNVSAIVKHIKGKKNDIQPTKIMNIINTLVSCEVSTVQSDSYGNNLFTLISLVDSFEFTFTKDFNEWNYLNHII